MAYRDHLERFSVTLTEFQIHVHFYGLPTYSAFCSLDSIGLHPCSAHSGHLRLAYSPTFWGTHLLLTNRELCEIRVIVFLVSGYIWYNRYTYSYTHIYIELYATLRPSCRHSVG